MRNDPTPETARSLLATVSRLERQRDLLASTIRLNNGAQVDAAGRGVLDTLSQRATRFIARIDRAIEEAKRGNVGDWSPAAFLLDNGRGPEIESIIKDSKFHREFVSERKVALGRPSRIARAA